MHLLSEQVTLLDLFCCGSDFCTTFVRAKVVKLFLLHLTWVSTLVRSFLVYDYFMSRKANYAFIDSQNLNLGVKSQGWKLDYKKFRLYLRNKYNVEKAYLFIGLIPGNENLYSFLSDAGFSLVFKQTVQYKEGNKITYKGNVDAELVLYAAAKTFNMYDKAIIISGDGDFKCLVEFLIEHNKLDKIICPNHHYSGLLREYSDHIDIIGKARNSLEYKK